MVEVIVAVILVLIIIYVVPFVVYGLLSVIWGLKPPEDIAPGRFLVSVFVSKTGTAIAFVLIFHTARDVFTDKWLLYAFFWWIMLAVGEIAETMKPNYTWKDAVAGIVSEALYVPAAAFVARWLLT